MLLIEYVHHMIITLEDLILGDKDILILLFNNLILIALGTEETGLQQSGFNWKEFIKKGEIIQVEIDERELNKKHPIVKYPIKSDANNFLVEILKYNLGKNDEWLIIVIK